MKRNMLHQQIAQVLSQATVYTVNGVEEYSYAVFFELLDEDADAMIAVLEKYNVDYKVDRDDKSVYITCTSEYDEIYRGVRLVHNRNKKKKRFIHKYLHDGKIEYAININDQCGLSTDGKGHIFILDTGDRLSKRILQMFKNYVWQPAPYSLCCSGTLQDFQHMARRILHEIPNETLICDMKYKCVSCGNVR